MRKKSKSIEETNLIGIEIGTTSKPLEVETEIDFSSYENNTIKSKDITVVKLLKEHEKAWSVTIPIPDVGIDKKELRDVTLPKSSCKIIKTGKKYDVINVPLWLVKKIADDVRLGLL